MGWGVIYVHVCGCVCACACVYACVCVYMCVCACACVEGGLQTTQIIMQQLM